MPATLSMPLTAEQMRQATAAKRLQEDPALRVVLDRIVENAAEQAIWLNDATGREEARQLVIAVTRLRVELQADAELPEVAKAAEEMARSFE